MHEHRGNPFIARKSSAGSLLERRSGTFIVPKAMSVATSLNTETCREHFLAHDPDEGQGLGGGDGYVVSFCEEVVEVLKSGFGDGVVDDAGRRGGKIWRCHSWVEDLVWWRILTLSAAGGGG